MSITLNGASGAVYQPDIMQVSKVVDTAVTNDGTDFVTVGDLTLPVGYGDRVILRYNIWYTTTATADFKYRVSIPGTPGLWRLVTETFSPGATSSGEAALTATVKIQDEEIASIANTGAGTQGYLRLTGFLHNGTASTNVGDVTFDFGQDTNDGSNVTTIRPGSFLEYRYF